MAKRRKPNRPNATGRVETSRFARLDHRLLHSSAYRALSPNARSLLVELTSLENGNNNGSLYLGVRDAAHRMGVVDLRAASRAFDDLQDLGFIAMTQDAHFTVKASETSRARCWRLTWLAGPGRKGPSGEYMNREPEPHTPARKRMELGLRAVKAFRKARETGRLPVLDSHTMHHFSPEMPGVTVLESDTSNHEDGGFLRKPVVRYSATHTADTMGDRVERRLVWWPGSARWSPTPRLMGMFCYALPIEGVNDI